MCLNRNMSLVGKPAVEDKTSTAYGLVSSDKVEGPASSQGTDPFALYEKVYPDGAMGYSAGFPGYPRNFTRDTVIAGILSSRSDILFAQLEISAKHQGKVHDPLTGEEPGKIHHEFPGVNVHGRNQLTTYNACDTTALFLIGVEGLLHLDNRAGEDFVAKHLENLRCAVDYILEHIGDDNLFWERPPKGATNYAILVSYWKDSILPNPGGKIEPTYPVVFSLAHFIAARGLLSASRLLNRDDLATIADTMYRTGIHEFIRSDMYVVYRDLADELSQPSSDELHALAYIPAIYSNMLPFESIRQRAEALATPFGYMCTPHDIATHLSDTYHGDKVWTHDQAKIEYGARKFALNEIADTAALVAPHIGEGQELLGIARENDNLLPIPEGNSHQLWSVAANEYFAGNSLLPDTQWL